MGNTSIEWTEKTWNPIRGCSRISTGCTRCYAERVAFRFSGDGLPYEGLAKKVKGEARWTGKVRLIGERLNDPLHWKKPQRIFVNSMSDLFHETLNNHTIARIFSVMQQADHHTYQVLTKRADRMAEWCMSASARLFYFGATDGGDDLTSIAPNIWMGVSAENQETYDSRLKHLLHVPAHTRWLSLEPLLEPIDLKLGEYADLAGGLKRGSRPGRVHNFIDWVVVGGESGHGARPFHINWARSVLEQCKRFGIRVFVKQMGGQPRFDSTVFATVGSISGTHLVESALPLQDRAGGDMSEWPKDLHVREYPVTGRSR